MDPAPTSQASDRADPKHGFLSASGRADGRHRREPLVLMGLIFAALLVSGVAPYDRPTWALEVFPVVVALAVLLATYRRFPLSPLAYRLLFVHALILIVGGHYTYARVPAGFWIQDMFDLARNHYDRLGHAAQGFVPAIVIRELLLRLSPLAPGKLLWLTVTSMCLAFSALYELIEWAVAVIAGGGAVEFLGTQGDPWDAQWDMFLALCGAIAAQVLLNRLQDRQLVAEGLTTSSPAASALTESPLPASPVTAASRSGLAGSGSSNPGS